MASGLADTRRNVVGDKQNRSLALKAFALATLGVGRNQLIGIVLTDPRPFMVGVGLTYIPCAPDSSFLSDGAIRTSHPGARSIFRGIGI